MTEKSVLDLDNLSDRHYHSGEPWAAKDFNTIRNSNGNEDTPDWEYSYDRIKL